MRFFVSLILFVLMSPVLWAENEAIQWSSQEILLDQGVQILPATAESSDILILSPSMRIDLETQILGDPNWAFYQSLSAAQKADFDQARRDMVLAAARLAASGRLESLSLVRDDQALVLAPDEESLKEKKLAPLRPMETVLGLSDKSQVKERASGLRSLLKTLNEAILVSTYRAAKEYFQNGKTLKGLTNEFGLQVTLKAEFQFGLGRINITKNLPIVISLGYRKDTREVLLGLGRRSEVMSGGSAFSAGVKVELRKYSRISSTRGTAQVEGVSWYPPALPMLSLVGDHGANYRSAGIVFGLNVADLIPGLYFVNTVNEFEDREIFVGSIRVPAISSWIHHGKRALNRLWRAPVSVPISCSQIFAL